MSGTSTSTFIWDVGSKQIFRPPYTADNVRMYAFLLPCREASLQALCDRAINGPSSGALRYRPVLPYVLLTFADIGKLQSGFQDDCGLGHGPERDVAFWVLAEREGAAGDGARFERLDFLIPYIFVNQPQAVATGREVYGFAKEMAAVVMDRNRPPGPMSASVFVSKRRDDPSQIICEEPVVTVQAVASEAPERLWAGAEEALRGLWEEVQAVEGLLDAVSNLRALFEMGSELLHRRLFVLFLKQFLDPLAQDHACYQAIVEAGLTPGGMTGVGLLPGHYQVTIPNYASHPIRENLGLADPLPPVRGLWMDFNFTLEAASAAHVAAPLSGEPPAVGSNGGGRRKVAILGGGMAGVAAAFELTDAPDWKNRFESITIYQMGWRLGGKGASGRDAGCYHRNLEHGLHVWFGFYDHAFRMMRRCYDELGRQPGQPLATWKEAFVGHDVIAFMEETRDGWKPWEVHFAPHDEAQPGDGVEEEKPPHHYIRETVKWMHRAYQSVPELHPAAEASPERHETVWERLQHLPHDLMSRLRSWWDQGVADARHFSELALLVTLSSMVDEEDFPHDQDLHHSIFVFLEEFHHRFFHRLAKDVESLDDDLRRHWILLRLAAITVIGLLKDGVIFKGLDSLDHTDISEWLKKHGADERLATSSPVRAVYELAFAYQNGSVQRPDWNFATPAALRGLWKVAFDYKGSIYYRMGAGMGETVFGPFYQVLKKRGVRFEFFHKVKSLGLGVDAGGNDVIDRIQMGRQTWLKGHENDSDALYDDPLVVVNGLPCWPSEPKAEYLPDDVVARLREAKAEHLDLESYYFPWRDAEVRNLARGQDFDLVILAIPPGAHPFICKELIARRPEWRNLHERVKTTQTQGVQLWLNRDLRAMGWSLESQVAGAYAESLDTWADMSQLIPREAWPAGAVRNIAYWCGPFADEKHPPSVADVEAGKASGWPKQQYDRVVRDTRTWVDANAGAIWPGIRDPSNPSGMDWSALCGSPGSTGEERFYEQYFRANYEPSERYVLSVKGSNAFRLRSDGTLASDPNLQPIANLFLAGDWTDNGFLNAGCIEATVRSSVQAAAALREHVER